MASDGFGELEDPLDRLERNERQGGRAFRFVLLSALAMVAVAVAVLTLTDVTGPVCAEPTDLCTTAGRVELVVFPTLLGFLLSLVSMWKTYRRWSNHIRWRPWLFATYGMWMLTTASLLLTASIAFVEVG